MNASLANYAQQTAQVADFPRPAYAIAGNDTIHFFKTGTSINKVDLNTVDYITAYGNYSKLIMKDKQLTISMPLKEIEAFLNNKDFIRIHRSCIVAIRKIDKIKDHMAYINSVTLPFGKLYREAFYASIFAI